MKVLLDQPVSIETWKRKYCLKETNGKSIESTKFDTFRRVARALTSVDSLVKTEEEKDKLTEEFCQCMLNGAIPAGRILSNAGASKYKHSTSLINCVVSPSIPDSIEGIAEVLKVGMASLKYGCGIGYCFSTLRPRGAPVAGAGASTAGPIVFMDIFDAACASIASAGGRRGAQMATFHVRHPDIMEFVQAKRTAGRLRMFNVSVLVTDDFMQAVKEDTDWALAFPVLPIEQNKQSSTDILWLDWPRHPQDNYVSYDVNHPNLILCRIYRTVKARELWNLIMQSAYDYAEPGILFIDRINTLNNLGAVEQLTATNPCVAKGTLIDTPDGYKEVETLKAGDLIHTISGPKPITTIEWHESVPVSLVICEDHITITATPNHIFHTATVQPYWNASWSISVRLKDLRPGNYLRIYNSTDNRYDYTKIIEIKPYGRSDVYDLYEQDTDTYLTHDGIINRGCGEQPLPPNGACLLGSINLTKFVENPFQDTSKFDWNRYEETIKVFTRMLDNVVEIANLPVKDQQIELQLKRRHGMGITGLGSTLTLLGIPYDSQEALNFATVIAKTLAIESYKEGINLASLKGSAPILRDSETFFNWFESPYMTRVKKAIESAYEGSYVKDAIESGCRFTHAVSIAPTGTISLAIGNNCSNGIEPSFAHSYYRNLLIEGKKSKEQEQVLSYEAHLWNNLFPGVPWPETFKTAHDISPKAHIDMVAAFQPWVDSAISKTINVPADYSFENFKDLYTYAYEKGLKGCAVYRPNPSLIGEVLVTEQALDARTYIFHLQDGTILTLKGTDQVEYEGATHTVSTLAEAINEGQYGKYLS